MQRLLYVLLFLAIGSPCNEAAQPVIRLVDFEDVAVTGATANRILGAIEEAEEQGNDLILIELDTPGGYSEALQDIVKGMLGSEIPIVVWVGPSGSRAASAGFFIMLAADVATMAPGTRCGAAATIYSSGEGKEDDVLLKKANNDMAALLRSIAEHRGRNVEKAEAAVFAADAYSEIEALDEGLIELVARDRDDLLVQLHEMEIKRFDGEAVVLETEGASFVITESNFRQKLFEFLATPAIASILLLLGMAGLYVEMSHPGLVFPAVVGAMCLILFFFAAQQLPISTIGILLVLLAVVMFILEIKVVSFGMLTLGGTVCLVIGLMMQVEGPIPELRVPPAVVIPSALIFAGLCAFVVRLVAKAQGSRVVTGVEGLAGKSGTVTEELAPEGKVFLHGELWNATVTRGTVAVGVRVRVVRAEDLMLTVEPADSRPEEG
jgi:membrane-bound serine protease (ClpP class)